MTGGFVMLWIILAALLGMALVAIIIGVPIYFLILVIQDYNEFKAKCIREGTWR